MASQGAQTAAISLRMYAAINEPTKTQNGEVGFMFLGDNPLGLFAEVTPSIGSRLVWYALCDAFFSVPRSLCKQDSRSSQQKWLFEIRYTALSGVTSYNRYLRSLLKHHRNCYVARRYGGLSQFTAAHAVATW